MPKEQSDSDPNKPYSLYGMAPEDAIRQAFGAPTAQPKLVTYCAACGAELKGVFVDGDKRLICPKCGHSPELGE